MSIIDWLIVILPFSFVMWLALRARLYVKDAVDFLAAGRVANRYVLCAGDLSAGLAVFTIVASIEQSYIQGFGVGFWGDLFAPLWIVMGLYGFVAYRWREVRCLSKGQFLEMRYGSKAFRIVTSTVSVMAEMLINALYPAITANFFIYYFNIPQVFHLFGLAIPTFAVVVTLCLILAVLMILPAGRVSLLVTDAIQGVFSYPIFAIVSIFILFKLDFDQDIAVTLADRVPGESFLNPYDVEKFRDFNIFAIVVNMVSAILNRGSWYGNDTTNSAKTPHEQKMAGLLGAFRNGFSWTLISLLAILVYVFMHGTHFNTINEKNPFDITSDEVRLDLSRQVLDEVIPDKPELKAEIMTALTAIPPEQHVVGVDKPYSQEEHPDVRFWNVVREKMGDTPEGRYAFQRYKSVFSQMRGPKLLSHIFPAGLSGLFILLMVMLLVSTDDSRIFNAVGCIVQDIVLPFNDENVPPEKRNRLKYRLFPCTMGAVTPERHIKWLRVGTILVACFFFVVGVFFSKIDYIQMVNTILMSIWIGGAGPIILGGLYTRFGNLTGAWCSLIFGSGFSTACCILQQTWAKSVCPWIESHPGWYDRLDQILRGASAPFEPWIHWEMSTTKFPINSYEVLAVSMILACLGYTIGSLVTYKPFDLEKFLHRGAYAPPEKLAAIAAAKAETKKKNPVVRFLNAMVSITPEYTKGDKIIAWAMFFYSFVWYFVIWFCGVVIWNTISPWTIEGWKNYLFIGTFCIGAIVGLISTIWFGIGCTMGIIRLFKDLKARVSDPTDYGRV